MKKTVVVCSRNRAMEDATTESLRQLLTEGAIFIEQKGTSCVALARNIALSGVCSLADRLPKDAVVLMVDDDMVFTGSDAQQLIDHARRKNEPASAVYVGQHGNVVGRPYKDGKWLMGLGLMAIPFGRLVELAKRSAKFDAQGVETAEFTWAECEDGVWMSEDWRLSWRLDGVRLLPISIGHIKKGPIYPTQDLEKLKAFIMNGG